ncbi:MAG: hypothetical protein AMXMBFR78_00450 [Rubrivivax sp.]
MPFLMSIGAVAGAPGRIPCGRIPRGQRSSTGPYGQKKYVAREKPSILAWPARRSMHARHTSLGVSRGGRAGVARGSAVAARRSPPRRTVWRFL